MSKKPEQPQAEYKALKVTIPGNDPNWRFTDECGHKFRWYRSRRGGLYLRGIRRKTVHYPAGFTMEDCEDCGQPTRRTWKARKAVEAVMVGDAYICDDCGAAVRPAQIDVPYYIPVMTSIS